MGALICSEVLGSVFSAFLSLGPSAKELINVSQSDKRGVWMYASERTTQTIMSRIYASERTTMSEDVSSAPERRGKVNVKMKVHEGPFVDEGPVCERESTNLVMQMGELNTSVTERPVGVRPGA